MNEVVGSTRTPRSARYDALAGILPAEARARMAMILTVDDFATLRHLAEKGTGANTLRAIASDLNYLETCSHAALGHTLPWPATEALVLKFIAHHLYDEDEHERDPAHGMPKDVRALLLQHGCLKNNGPHAPATVRRRLARQTNASISSGAPSWCSNNGWCCRHQDGTGVPGHRPVRAARIRPLDGQSVNAILKKRCTMAGPATRCSQRAGCALAISRKPRARACRYRKRWRNPDIDRCSRRPTIISARKSSAAWLRGLADYYCHRPYRGIGPFLAVRGLPSVSEEPKI